MLPKWHRKAVLCAGHHFSDTFDSISKKNLRLAHFLLGTGPILHAFLLQACSSTQHTRSHLLHVDCLYPISSSTAGTKCQCGGRPCREETLWSSQDTQDSSGTRNFPTHLPVHFGVRRRPFSDQFNVWGNHNPAAAVCGD